MERKYEFSDGVLTFNVSTASIDRSEFELALANAVGWTKGDLTVDMSNGDYIASQTIGQLMVVAVGLNSKGHRLKVVAHPKVALMLERTGFAKVGEIEAAEK